MRVSMSENWNPTLFDGNAPLSNYLYLPEMAKTAFLQRGENSDSWYWTKMIWYRLYIYK